MTNKEISYTLAKLIEATRLVASDFEVQVSVLPSYVHVPDEIALVFQDAYNSVEQIVEYGIINSNQHKLLSLLNNCLDEISLWTLDSLKEADEWNNVRVLARDVLVSLKENSTKIPDLFWIKFVSGE